MQQTFEFYTVDTTSWKDFQRIENVESCTITRDASTNLLESATIDTSDSLNEQYVRIYLIAIQGNEKEKIPLGTFLVQSPSYSFDGKKFTNSLDAYSPLIELKENSPIIGYTILKETKKSEETIKTNILENVVNLISEHSRAPVIESISDATLYYDFTANTDDTWLSFITDLLQNAKYHIELDALGHILLAPDQKINTLQPVWTYTDDNSSILSPDISVTRDFYEIPNIVEVIYSSGKNYYYSKAVNNDPNSPTSIPSRGREIVKRITNPDLVGTPTDSQIDWYAKNTLESLSTLEYTIDYSHGYCPVRVGDCIRIDYKKANLRNIKAKVTNQTINCETSCSVSETAVFTQTLWEA